MFTTPVKNKIKRLEEYLKTLEKNYSKTKKKRKKDR